MRGVMTVKVDGPGSSQPIKSRQIRRSGNAAPAVTYLPGPVSSFTSGEERTFRVHRGVMFQYFEWNCRADGSLWRELASKALELKNLGTTAVWFPPAYKAMDGDHDTGYAAYDLYDLGEFDQKGSVRTKYGTRQEFLDAVYAIQEAGMHCYADVVFNHRMGADETEEVEIEEICCDNRNVVQSAPYKIHAWSHYPFAGRAKKYSDFEWHWQHFNAFGANANAPGERVKIYRVRNKAFSGYVCFE